MFSATGWIAVRASRDALALVDASDFDAIDQLDQQLAQLDEQLWDAIEQRLLANSDPWLLTTFDRQLNNDQGLLTLRSSRNHRPAHLFHLLEWIAEIAPGSYGLVYVYDDEDAPHNQFRNRGQPRDHSNEFRVWRILKGRLEELDDPFLSPIDERIGPSM